MPLLLPLAVSAAFKSGVGREESCFECCTVWKFSLESGQHCLWLK